MKNKLSSLLLIFSVLCVAVNAQVTVLANFNDITTTSCLNGSSPSGDLISDGAFLYGMTPMGGATGYGTIFKVKPDGSGFTSIFDFNGTNGYLPWGSLITDGTYLYGMTEKGGANSDGTVFKVKSNGSGFMNIFDFDISTTGTNPYGSLITDGTYLYGMTASGGANLDGTVFKVKSNGSGFMSIFDFDISTTGYRPMGSLISDGAFLYGMTLLGGTNGVGTVFKVKSDGSGFTTLFNFPSASTAGGRSPQGSLYSDGTYLYGMTQNGGTGGYGTIFKIKPDGTAFNTIYNFGTMLGGHPNSSLISDGTYLYGTTSSGGTGALGTVFKIKPDGSGYSNIVNSAEGPKGSLYSDGSYLYGTSTSGGLCSGGTVFKISLTSTGIPSVTDDKEFSIYPNPSDGNFTLSYQFHNLLNVANFTLFDITGRVVYQTTLNATGLSKDISLGSIYPGVYFWKVSFDKGLIATGKLSIIK